VAVPTAPDADLVDGTAPAAPPDDPPAEAEAEAEGAASEAVRLRAPDGELVAIGKADGGWIAPVKVLRPAGAAAERGG
jgi:hypothetical protein